MAGMPLTRQDAIARAAVVTPTHYAVSLDFTVSDTEFESLTSLRFEATPGASTFVDIDPVSIHVMTLNGAPISQAAFDGRRVHLGDLREHNELVVSARMKFSQDGQGLHRATDPADGNAYIYGHLFMDAAPRVFACFDQPDLKAPYTFSVTAPAGWTVLSNAPMVADGDGDGDGVWRGEQKRPLATYFVTICAGPYASVRDERAGTPLGIHARASLAPRLREQAPALMELTKTYLDYFENLFGIDYPFGEYHQVFVPEFNAGAMENPGCVTFRDQMIFTGVASESEVLSRANTVAHEMAHMWFGDLVTMRWWDNLWLNESFAEYLASRALVETETFPHALVDIAAGRKAWGYAAERSPSTHPVAGAPADDTDTALQNFDGISYAKGSAALRQLVAAVGDDDFLAGLRAHLSEHAFGNATLADFLGHVSDHTSFDVRRWAQQWLTTAGMDTLVIAKAQPQDTDGVAAELRIEPDERYPSARTHELSVSCYAPEGHLLARDQLTRASGHVPLPQVSQALTQQPGAIIVPNPGDETWAPVAFDDSDVPTLMNALAGIECATTRAVVWTSLAHALATATVSPLTLLAHAQKGLAHETNSAVLDVAISTLTADVLGRFVQPEQRPLARETLTRLADDLIGDSLTSAGSPQGEESAAESDKVYRDATENARMLAGVRLLARVGSADRVAPWVWGSAGAQHTRKGSSSHEDRPGTATSGAPPLPGALAADTNLRWTMAANLARQGAINVAELDELLEADTTMSGRRGYLHARASLPDAEHKEWAWQELTSPPTPQDPAHSNYEMNALASAFFTGSADVLLAYVERYVEDVPSMGAWVGQDALARIAALAFPASLASVQLDVEIRRMLERNLSAAVLRAVTDQRALIDEVLTSRDTFGY